MKYLPSHPNQDIKEEKSTLSYNSNYKRQNGFCKCFFENFSVFFNSFPFSPFSHANLGYFAILELTGANSTLLAPCPATVIWQANRTNGPKPASRQHFRLRTTAAHPAITLLSRARQLLLFARPNCWNDTVNVDERISACVFDVMDCVWRYVGNPALTDLEGILFAN